MHWLERVTLIASLAYVGTMFDNFFAFAAQLVVTDRSRFRRVSWAQVTGVAALLVISAAVGSALAGVPLRWVGLACVAPWALAGYAWRHRRDEHATQFRRGALTTFVVTLALGGDNLAVWIPLVRASGVGGALVDVAVFAVWEIVFLWSAQRLAGHPGVVAWGERHAPTLVPWVYLALGVLVLVECGTL
jgi:cadmium resistance protein CadD (predicted permease)